MTFRIGASFALLSLALGAMTTAVSAEAADKPTVIMVSGPLFDPFFGAMKQGADDAAQAVGVDFQYVTLSENKDVEASFAHLLEQSVSRHPAALIAGDFFPNSEDPILTKAAASGLPVIIADGGEASWKKVGALNYVGYIPGELGKTAGAMQVKAGVKHGLCFNHVPGTVQHSAYSSVLCFSG